MAFMKPNLLWLDDESSTLQPDEPYLIPVDIEVLRKLGQCLFSGHRCQRHFCIK